MRESVANILTFAFIIVKSRWLTHICQTFTYSISAIINLVAVKPTGGRRFIILNSMLFQNYLLTISIIFVVRRKSFLVFFKTAPCVAGDFTAYN